MKTLPPVVFLSYDEPNANTNYHNLLTLVPSALRVHGVKGFDSAHKAAAKLVREKFSDATHFFTVDGDNQLIPRYWHQLKAELLAMEQAEFDNRLGNQVLCWRAINHVNGLCYGNGGLKLWPIKWVEEMRTYEASEGETSVDFCWKQGYRSAEGILSITYVNGSPYQAWRAGFREGVKMATDSGKPQDRFDIAQQATQLNLRRFTAWASVGADVDHGFWCCYGALEGFWVANSEDYNPEAFIDYDDFYPRMWENLEANLTTYWLNNPIECPTLIQSSKDWKLKMRDWNLNIPSLGKLQSATCKLLMEYYQPTKFLESEPCGQKITYPL